MQRSLSGLLVFAKTGDFYRPFLAQDCPTRARSDPKNAKTAWFTITLENQANIRQLSANGNCCAARIISSRQTHDTNCPPFRLRSGHARQRFTGPPTSGAQIRAAASALHQLSRHHRPDVFRPFRRKDALLFFILRRAALSSWSGPEDSTCKRSSPTQKQRRAWNQAGRCMANRL